MLFDMLRRAVEAAVALMTRAGEEKVEEVAAACKDRFEERDGWVLLIRREVSDAEEVEEDAFSCNGCRTGAVRRG
jgi:ribosomal protein L37AE/L43A